MDSNAYQITSIVVSRIELITHNFAIKFRNDKIGMGICDISKSDAIVAPQILKTGCFDGQQCWYVILTILIHAHRSDMYLLVALCWNGKIKLVVGIKLPIGDK